MWSEMLILLWKVLHNEKQLDVHRVLIKSWLSVFTIKIFQVAFQAFGIPGHELYPCIGLGSAGEQVQLVDRAIWGLGLDAETNDNEEHPVVSIIKWGHLAVMRRRFLL